MLQADAPEYLTQLITSFESQIKTISEGRSNFLLIGEGKQYRSMLSAVAQQTIGVEIGYDVRSHIPSKAGFVVLFKTDTRSRRVQKFNLAFPIYVPARKSHAWPGVVSMVTVIDNKISNHVVLVRIGWRKKLAFIPIRSPLLKKEEIFEKQSDWDILTRSLNADHELLRVFGARKWDGGMVELQLHLESMVQLIPFLDKAIIEHSFFPKPSGFHLTGYQWNFHLGDKLQILETLAGHVEKIDFRGESARGEFSVCDSLAVLEAIQGESRSLYFPNHGPTSP